MSVAVRFPSPSGGFICLSTGSLSRKSSSLAKTPIIRTRPPSGSASMVRPVLFIPGGGPWEMFERISSEAERIPSAVPPSQVVTRASIAGRLLGGGGCSSVRSRQSTRAVRAGSDQSGVARYHRRSRRHRPRPRRGSRRLAHSRGCGAWRVSRVIGTVQPSGGGFRSLRSGSQAEFAANSIETALWRNFPPPFWLCRPGRLARRAPGHERDQQLDPG